MLKQHVVLIVVEVALVAVLLWATVWRSRIRRRERADGLDIAVTRRPGSWTYLTIAFFVLFGFVGLIISIEDLPGRTKGILITVNTPVLLYLCFFNDWFRDKIVRNVNRSMKMKERR
jgi:hypothetical protein